MMLLHREATSTQRDLIRRTSSDKAGMARTVADLEELGYLTRTRSKNDRRVEHLALTSDGEAAFATAQSLATETALELFDGFTEAELTTLAALLARFADR